MTAKLAEEELRFRRHHRPFCVAMLDIDHFKRINDACGHQEGDRVLQAFARLARRHFPAPDQVARWGGEEFVALMPESDLAAATATLEAMLDEADIHAGVDGRTWRVTFCAGVAQARTGEPVGELLKRADAALYRGKAEGRNRIVGARA
jgi:diguanylate cyclase (GGDEF)-like protein